MAHDNRKRLLIGAAGLIGLLVAVLLALPSFIDVDAYKPEIVAQVKRATGRDVAIDRPIRLSLLPTPSVELDGVKFFNVPGSKNPNMAEMKSLTVKPSLLALLMGDVEVAEMTLVEPKIFLEVNAEGKPNWVFASSASGSALPPPVKALVDWPARHRERHADVQRFQGGAICDGRQGQLRRLGRLDRRASFVDRRCNRQR
jgi:uncharacterized protein involved in outer membrane biogenesis